jgi:tetratricopeptide (TPR) repeat protein
VLLTRKYTRKVIFGSLFFLVSLLPVLQFVPIKSAIVADRYAYISLFGLFYLAACGFVWLYTRTKVVTWLRPILLGLLITIVGVLGYLTWQRCQVWRDSITLWNDVLANYSTRADAYNNRGVTYYMQGNIERAMPDYNKAIELDPGFVAAYYNRANAYYNHGDLIKALSDYSKVIELAPGFAEAYQKRKFIYYMNKEYDKSWEDVHKLEELGYQVGPKFIKNLKEASGSER